LEGGEGCGYVDDVAVVVRVFDEGWELICDGDCDFVEVVVCVGDGSGDGWFVV